jgi:hypothetical protein
MPFKSIVIHCFTYDRRNDATVAAMVVSETVDYGLIITVTMDLNGLATGWQTLANTGKRAGHVITKVETIIEKEKIVGCYIVVVPQSR